MSTNTPKPTIQKEGPLTSRDVPGREDVQRPQDQPASVDDPGAAAPQPGDPKKFHESAKQQREQSDAAIDNMNEGFD